MDVIKLKNVTAGYEKNNVLNNISTHFEKGTLTSIIGINGCGKSTLLKVILGILPMKGGIVELDDISLTAMTRTEIAQKAAYLAQGRTTPDMTVGQMVLHGRFPHLNYPRRYGKKDHEIAFSAMEQMGIRHLAHQSLHTLSGGMRQNAYIAIALAQDTDYILLDEPATYLDISHQLELLKTLRSLADNGKGIITVMHDLPMALTFSDRILILNNGEIICDGEPKQVYEQAYIEELFGVSIGISADGQTYHYNLTI